MVEKSNTNKFIPKGARKGGTRFPRQPLSNALVWVKKLVVKTHLAPQPQDVILSGVVGNSGSMGQVRISTIKQYGFLEGDSKAYSASSLAKQYESSPPEEKIQILRKAALEPAVFKALFDTFQGDEVSAAKLRQRAAELKVHPEETEKCAENYISSMITAELARVEGDKVIHISAAETLKTARNTPPENEDTSNVLNDDENIEEDSESDLTLPKSRARAVFNVTINLDASLDAEKLEKQLKLLKRYGAI